MTFSINGTSEKEKTSVLKQSFALKVIPSDKLNFTLKGEHFSNRMDDDYTKNFYLVDFMATYKVSNRFSLDCQLTNLFDEREYAYISFTNDAMRISQKNMIRPRNILIGAYVTI